MGPAAARVILGELRLLLRFYRNRGVRRNQHGPLGQRAIVVKTGGILHHGADRQRRVRVTIAIVVRRIRIERGFQCVEVCAGRALLIKVIQGDGVRIGRERRLRDVESGFRVATTFEMRTSSISPLKMLWSCFHVRGDLF